MKYFQLVITAVGRFLVLLLKSIKTLESNVRNPETMAPLLLLLLLFYYYYCYYYYYFCYYYYYYYYNYYK